MNKDLATKLADDVERLLVENITLRNFVNGLHRIAEERRKREPHLPKAATPQDLIAASYKIGGIPSLAQEILRPVRAEIESAETLDQVIERIRLAIPKSQEEN